MKSSSLLLILLSSVCLSQSALAAPPKKASTPVAVSTSPAVARVNDVTITREALDKVVERTKTFGMQDSPETRQALVFQLITRELLRQEAARFNLQNDPGVLDIVEDARTNAMIERIVSQSVKPAPVTEEEIKAEYDKIVATLGPVEYKTRLIQVADEKTAQSIAAEIAQGAKFEDLAKRHSQAPSAAKGGELDWVSFKLPATAGQTQGYPLVVADAITRLIPGGVSPVLSENGAWYLTKLEAQRATTIPGFAATRSGLERQLKQRHLEQETAAFVMRLMSKGKVERY